MSAAPSVLITALGQVGVMLEYSGDRIVVDPYLSNSVAETFGSEFDRMVPAPFRPEELPALDYVLLTHTHMDHTDPATLVPLLTSQPNLRIMAPFEAREVLAQHGLREAARPFLAWTSISEDIRIRAIPAAHPEILRSSDGETACCGYLIYVGGLVIYHAGDTSPHEEIFSSLEGEDIDVGFLPVNERNHYRDAAGIIGNMSLREAFRMAGDLKIKTLIPTHWDIFAPNSVHREEIELFHQLQRPPFAVKILTAGETLTLNL